MISPPPRRPRRPAGGYRRTPLCASQLITPERAICSAYGAAAYKRAVPRWRERTAVQSRGAPGGSPQRLLLLGAAGEALAMPCPPRGGEISKEDDRWWRASSG